MSEPFLDRLSRFTPDAGGLNRDALLFAAGRGSARPNRRWMSLAAVLAGTQVLSLVLLWPQAAPLGDGMTVKLVTVPMRPATLEAQGSEAMASPGVWSARHSLTELEPEDRPTDTVTLVDSEPPLRAFTPSRSSLSNQARGTFFPFD